MMGTLARGWIGFLALVTLASGARAGDVEVQLDSGAGFAVKNAIATVERLRVDEATGNISRNGALLVHTTGGFDSLFVGSGGGLSNTGWGNVAVGARSLSYNTTGIANAAFGRRALHYNTTGTLNTAVGEAALYHNTTGDANSAMGNWALLMNTSGVENTAVGRTALAQNTTGTRNVAVGNSALYQSNASGNTAVGMLALTSNTVGFSNNALGYSSLLFNTAGSYNVAIGNSALFFNTTASRNTAVGDRALLNTIGHRNVAVGSSAGANQTTGSDNLYLANLGVAAEFGQIRIGTVGTHTGATIAGISGATSAGGIAVLVNASGKLGTTTSSARFKEDVRDMGAASDVLMKLRSVVFRYREGVVGAEDAKTTQYGLIAEEVAEVAPELVAPDLEGRPYSVKYHELPALLVNEVQAQRRRNEEQQRLIAAQNARIERLERALADR
jgi:hypothetical protein